MAALTNRDELEARLTRLLGKAGREATALITSALGDPPDINRLTTEVLEQLEAQYAVLVPELESIYVEAANSLIADVGIGVEWDVINRSAQQFAREYGFNLVRGIRDNSRSFLQTAVSDFFQTATPISQLEAQIARYFGVNRAQNIAITETTRAAVEAERAMTAELERASGVRIQHVWQTSNDSRTCPICGPRHGKVHGDGWQDYPPAHPRCRCWITSEVLVPETA